VYMTGGNGPSRGLGFIYSAEDAFTVRTAFRLLGDFVGTLPKHTAQNQYLGLPLVLSYEEVTLGYERGFLRLLSDSPDRDYVRAADAVAARAASDAFYAARDADFERQAAIAVEIQEKERERHLLRRGTLPKEDKAPEAAGKRQQNSGKGREKSKKRRRASDAGNGDGGTGDGGDRGERPAKTRKVGEAGLFARVSLAVHGALHWLAPALVGDPRAAAREAAARDAARLERAFTQAKAGAMAVTPVGARPGERRRPTIAESVPRPLGLDKERAVLRGCVFRDLYDKGYCMSCGAKFGSDFLAYAGEPLLFHAALAVIVVRADEPVSPLDVVALGRLGDSTKKRTVLAYVDGDPAGVHVVRYVGVQWEETLP
jgi:tRNA splicing endonuclease